MRPAPLSTEILFRIGPVAVSDVVVTTWAIVAALGIASWLATRRLQVHPGRTQVVLEAIVTGISAQIRDAIRSDPQPFLPLIGTLFLFLVVANLCGELPGVKAPTARLETSAALASIVFVSVHVYGIRARGVRGYFAHYLRPNPLMLPLNVLAEITRTFSLMVRLFGNIMSHELVISIVLALAGLLVPVPLMALGVLIGIVQAYIFAVLATVFIGAAVGSVEGH